MYDLVSQHLKLINCDRWAELYWKKQLESLSSNKKIQTHIEKLKAHEWMKKFGISRQAAHRLTQGL